MAKYPQTPEEWNDAKFIIFRHFEFRSRPDLDVLMRLVKDNIPDRGNNRYLRARLLGILRSQESRANKIFWIKQENPKTWRIKLAIKLIKEWLHRILNTRHYKGQVYLYNLSSEVIAEMQKEIERDKK